MTRNSRDDEEWAEEKNRKRTPERKEGQSGCRCMVKLFIALLIVGGVVGALIGVYGIEEMKSWVGLGLKLDPISIPDDTGTGTNSTNNGDGGGDPDPPVDPPVDPDPPIDPNACNGLLSNCGMKVNELLFASVHNSNHHENPFPNNEAPLEEALEAGYRSLQIDVCKCPNEENESIIEVVFCHGFCTIGRRDPVSVFTNISDFLKLNEKEVVIINFELNDANGGTGVPTSQELWDLIPNVGLNTKVYDYQGGEWPTLQNLLDDDKQLIFFKHNGNVCNNGDTSNGCVDKIEELHTYTLETRYDLTTIMDMEDATLGCSGDRGVDGTKDFYALNNFLPGFTSLPSKQNSETLNSKAFLEKRLEDCETLTGLKPNFINVDFWQIGDLVEVVRDANQARALSAV